ALFWSALETGALGQTYQRHHPGVTTMWIAGLGMRVFMMMHGWTPEDLMHPSGMMSGPQGPPAQAGVAALSFAIAACIALVFVLLTRLANGEVAFTAGCLLALDPFHLTHSKMIHVDGLLTVFMFLAALFLIAYVREKKWLYLTSSGIFTGLALLTKSPSLFLIPYAVLVLSWHAILGEGRAHADRSGFRVWMGQLPGVSRDLVAWTCVAMCVFLLLWPAMWVKPGKVLSNMYEGVSHHVETPHPSPNFFAGQVVERLGPLYYPATLGWKTTLVSLTGTVATILFLFRWRQREEGWELPWYVVIYVGAFLLMMTLGAKKWARYVLPAFAGLDVLAGWGVVRVAHAAGNQPWARKRTWIPTAIVAVALVAQGAIVLRRHPYYGTHHNILLGGSRVAQRVLHLGDQGEGLDLAAGFLNSLPGADRLSAGVQDTNNLMFRSNFVGRTHSIEDREVDYRVFFVHYNQRTRRDSHQWELWQQCLLEPPIWSVAFDGAPYVWICSAYPNDPEALAITQRLNVQLGDRIRLVGYDVSSSSVSAGDALVVTLFWQREGRLDGDYHVFVHLMDGDELLGAQHDGVPVQGERPTWTWQQDEVLRDEHTLVTNPGLQSGTYTLSVGMYDYLTKVRLPATGADGKRWPADRVVLQDIQVTVSQDAVERLDE
ncbi:MAG: glycosyltransferase family 39 protein, partial [Anaerolineae bacterium]